MARTLREALARLAPRAVVAAATFAAIAPGAGCTARPEFRCAANDACVSENGAAGICEANRSCSFPDNACVESGRRYSDGASGGLASACVSAPAASKCVAQLGLGTNHSCVVKTDGSAWCWGDNAAGQLGDNSKTSRGAPARVALPAGVKVTSLAAGEEHTCALDDKGSVWCWGDNATQQLGVQGGSSLVPVQVHVTDGSTPPKELKVTAITAGGKHTCAVADKVLYCWGENSDGQCGSDPAKGDDIATPTAVAGLEGVVAASVGDEFSCALRDDKSVWCFGANANGELGNGSTTPSFAPVKVGLSSVAALAAGDEHVCAVKDDSSIWCWGYGASGSIGIGTTEDQRTPVSITSAKTAISSGQAFHTCALAPDATLRCWGANDSGQIGAGRPEANVLTPTSTYLVTVKLVALGGKHSCATTIDGALWCWGLDDSGQLGLGAPGPIQPLPQRVALTCP